MCAARSDMRKDSSKSSSRRKYLGDAADPHFVPTSPIITRQVLSDEQEEELTKVCTLVLSGVQHSDDDDEDEDRLLSYIKNHGTAAKAQTEAPKDVSIVPKPAVALASELISKSQKLRSLNRDTATPSVTSKRDTIDRTNTSTPLTILSETFCRPSSKGKNNGLRNESKPTKAQAVYSILEKRLSNYRLDTGTETKPTATLPLSQANTATQASHVPTSKIGHISISNLEYNKSLPSLPRTDTPGPTERQTSSLSRFFENMKKKTDGTASGALSRLTDSGVKHAQTTSEVPTAKKNYSKLGSLFDRKKKQHSTQLTVS